MTPVTVHSKEDLLKRISESRVVKRKKNRALKEVEEKLESIKTRNKLNYDIFLGGSFAKGTDIKGSDIDVFLLFPDNFDPYALLKLLRKEFPEGTEEYSDHPYLVVPHDSFSIDLVPGYKLGLSEKLVTAVDRTPLHVNFVKNNFTEEMKDEAKILKQFLKGIGVYGAESSVQGFSGYVAELMIYRYGSFDKTLEGASKWIAPVRLANGTNKFENANIAIIDPVDSGRNASANVSKENLSTFILAARLFSWKNWKNFFFPTKGKHILPENAVAIFIPCKRCNEETLIPNLRRIGSVLKRELEAIDFRIIYSSVFMEKGGFIMIIPETTSLGEVEIHYGPPVTSLNVTQFIEKWSRGTKYGMPFVMGDRICVLRKRKTTDISQAIADVIPRVKLSKDFDTDKILLITGQNLDSLPESITKNFVTPSLGKWIQSVSGDI